VSGILSADPEATLTATSGTPQSAAINQAFATNLVATLKDSQGEPIPNAVLGFTIPLSGASAVLSSLGGATDASGQISISATANGISGSYSASIGAGTLEPTFDLENTPATPTGIFAVGSGGGALATVSTFSLTGTQLLSFIPFAGYDGPLSVATGDVSGDGTEDVIVGARAASSAVKVFSGTDGSLIYSFLAFPGFDGGVSVAAGDVNGDGDADIIVAAGAGGSSHVEVFSGKDGSVLMSFFAFSGYNGAVSVAAGDVNGDGRADIVTTAVTGPASGTTGVHVKVFSGVDGSVLSSFLAFQGYMGDVTVAAGDLAGDGHAEIVLGAGTGGSQVATYNGETGAAILGFQAFNPLFQGGVRVGVSGTKLVLGAGPGAGPDVELSNGTTGNQDLSFYAFDPNYVSGIFVG
jgi:hypothetical protein